eukprot:973280-Prorocentrum_minimum.AAC.1
MFCSRLAMLSTPHASSNDKKGFCTGKVRAPCPRLNRTLSVTFLERLIGWEAGLRRAGPQVRPLWHLARKRGRGLAEQRRRAGG